MRVMLDPGHGGFDAGMIVDGVIEKDVVLEYAREIGKLLEERGHVVVFTRNDDRLLPHQSILDAVFATKPDAFVSIHAGSGYPSHTGFQVVARSSSHHASVVMAAAIRVEMHKRVFLMDRGTKFADRMILRQGATRPAVVVEVGFITNRYDREMLASDEGRRAVCRSIARGIDYYYAAQGDEP